MATTVTIRNVPESTRAELAARAARSGRSLQEYLLAQLQAIAQRATAEDLLAQIRERKRRTASTLSVESILSHRDADRR